MNTIALATRKALKLPHLALGMAAVIGAALLLGFALVVSGLTQRAEQAHEHQRLTGQFGAEPPAARAHATRQRTTANTRAVALVQP